MKQKKVKKSQIEQQLEKMLESYDCTEILDNLISQCERGNTYDNMKDIDCLVESMKNYLTIVHGCNIVKAETLKEQMEFEESINKLFPFNFQYQTQIQLAL
jgi:hypothetical protein